MPRPRHPVPLSLADLIYNPKTGKYEISEMGVIYQMDIEHTRSLKVFYRNVSRRGKGSLIIDWYNNLDQQSKKEINRIGNIATDTDFYTDKKYED